MNEKQYGLTAQTVLFYSDMVRCGFNWGLAMSKLKELYEHNASLSSIASHSSNKAIATIEDTECGL